MVQGLKFLVVHLAASLVQSHFLPVKEDPADALVDKMVQGAGFDDESTIDSPVGDLNAKYWQKQKSSSSNQPAPSHGESFHARFGSHDLVKLQPLVSVTGLVMPKQWQKTTSDETDVSDSLPTPKEADQSVLTKDYKTIDQMSQNDQLLHELITQRHSHDQAPAWDQSGIMDTDEVNKELDNMAPKEVVKVSHQDTVVHASAVESPVSHGLAHLGQSVNDYGPLSQVEPVAPPIEPTTFSLHHGHVRAPVDASPMKAPKVSKPAVPAVASVAKQSARFAVAEHVAKQMISGRAPDDDLASSLAAHFAETNQTKVEDAPRVEDAPKKINKPGKDQEGPKSTAIGSVHRSKRNEPRFAIKPEDMQQGTNQAAIGSPTSPSQSPAATNSLPATSMPAKPSPQKPERKAPKVNQGKAKHTLATPQQKWQNLFKANAVDGKLGAEDIETIFEKLKIQKEWNWHPFDLNGDDKLSQSEFLNAMRVAVRFKIHNK